MLKNFFFKNKGNNYKSQNYKKNHNNFLNKAFFLIFIISALLIFSSCSTLLTSPEEKIDVANSQEYNESDITQPSSDESLALEEEIQTIESIDLENAKIGAEIVGYIPSYLCTNKDNFIKITITNTSDFTWRNKKPYAVRIGYHYFGQDVDFADYDRTTRTEFPKQIEPNESITIEVLINDITNPGYYIVQIDPVMEGSERPEDNFWFSSKGVKMLEGLAYFGPSQSSTE